MGGSPPARPRGKSDYGNRQGQARRCKLHVQGVGLSDPDIRLTCEARLLSGTEILRLKSQTWLRTFSGQGVIYDLLACNQAFGTKVIFEQPGLMPHATREAGRLD